MPPTWKTRSNEASGNGSACASATSMRTAPRPGRAPAADAEHPHAQVRAPGLHVEPGRERAEHERDVGACPHAHLQDPQRTPVRPRAERAEVEPLDVRVAELALAAAELEHREEP